MNTFSLNISSPDGSLFKGNAVKISLRGADGDLAVMAGHIPFITSVKPCEFHFELDDETVRCGRTDGGILTVSGDEVVFLTGNVTWL
jgi:F-type H+-transporting ATPase subunit epsilon